MIIRTFQENGIGKSISDLEIDTHRRDCIRQHFLVPRFDEVLFFLGFHNNNVKRKRLTGESSKPFLVVFNYFLGKK